MNQTDLAKRLRRASQAGDKTLDLSKQGLTTLPAEIGELTSLLRLDLSDNQLTSLPPSLGKLSALTHLDVSLNRLTRLPREIGQLGKLRLLNLNDNSLTTIPNALGDLLNLRSLYVTRNLLSDLSPTLGHLAKLVELALGGNQFAVIPSVASRLPALEVLWFWGERVEALPANLSAIKSLNRAFLGGSRLIATIPPELCELPQLVELSIRKTSIETLPAEVRNLTQLQVLDLAGNSLAELAPELGALSALRSLDVSDNRLTTLPPELAALTRLKFLELSGNPLTAPPPEIVEQGTSAILAYLQEQHRASLAQWVSKVLLVGEGGVGKTSLLRALRGVPFDAGLATTHGVEVETIKLGHPQRADIAMTLKTWDFGGQEIYHATHQFFLTNRSLFLLVWNARAGFEQCKLYYWLDTIQARAPQSPVLLVATHVDERSPDIPLAEIRLRYPRVAGLCSISCKTGAGLDELRRSIASEAAGLPLMGETWPANWLRAANAARTMTEQYVTAKAFRELLARHALDPAASTVLSQWLHELGDILFFQEDPELNDIVVCRPHWVTQYLSRVLDAEQVIKGQGIFARADRDAIWSDLEPSMRDHLLRLMEKFDLSYRTDAPAGLSIVVERLPMDAPAFEPRWSDRGASREIVMKFRLNTTMPPGLPTWFLARTFRFATGVQWRYGALLADGPTGVHLGLVQAYPHERYVRMVVRGPSPHNFFVLLRDGLELTLGRFPGLQVSRTIPCPGHEGAACAHEFDYANLERAIERTPPIAEIQCPLAFKNVSVSGLVFGLHWSTEDDVLARIGEIQAHIAGGQKDLMEALGETRTLAQRQFTTLFRLEQAKSESHCPNVFVLKPRGDRGWASSLIGQRFVLKLYCQAPGQWHPVADGGEYEIEESGEWLKVVAPYVRHLVRVLKFIAPLAGPWAAVAAPDYEKLLRSDIKLMEDLVKKLPEIERAPGNNAASLVGDVGPAQRVEGAALRALRVLLDEKDPQQKWGGLRKVLTPEGHLLWLCVHHTGTTGPGGSASV